MFKKPVRENSGKETRYAGGVLPPSVGRSHTARRPRTALPAGDLSREPDAQPRRAMDLRGKDRPVIARYSGAGCDLPRPGRFRTAARSL